MKNGITVYEGLVAEIDIANKKLGILLPDGNTQPIEKVREHMFEGLREGMRAKVHHTLYSGPKTIEIMVGPVVDEESSSIEEIEAPFQAPSVSGFPEISSAK